jgi:hypothetical protein
MRAVEDYTMDWVPLPWMVNGAMGKFSAVRYCLNSTRPDEATVVPMFCGAVSNNSETIRIAASEFAKEKHQLEQEAQRIIREAYERARRIVDRRG